MKHSGLILVILFICYPGLIFSQSKDIPAINQDIVKYIRTVIGEQVGRGECWDLADAALTVSHAKFDKSSQKTLYIFGDEYNPKKVTVLPGDILQMENVIVKYQNDNMVLTENYGHHTAIVYEVVDDKNLKIAHQNTSFSGRTVGISILRLNDVQKGKIRYYRPIPL